jgi:Trk K+ transport system NAD-binding subunit
MCNRCDACNKRQATGNMATSSYHDHVIVCGLGKVGFRVVEEFLSIGQDVLAIESDERRGFNELVRGQGVHLIIGDARQEELLRRAGLAHCLALVIVTNDDLTNLDIALTARELRPDLHIVMRAFNDTLARKLEASFGIRTAFSTSAIAAPTFAAAALMRGVRHALHVGRRLLSTIDLTIRESGQLHGRTLDELEQRYNIAAIELRRFGEQHSDLRPSGELRLAAGDTLVVVGELQILAELRRLNNDRQYMLAGTSAAELRRLQSRQAAPPDDAPGRAARREPRPGLLGWLTYPLRRGWRLFRANLRDLDLLLRDSVEPLSAFLVFLLLGTLLLHGLYNPNTGEMIVPGYVDPNTGATLGWGEAFYAMFMMATFQGPLDYPERHWWIQAIFFLWPVLSVVLLARGALSFFLLLLDKRNRREAWDVALASTYRDHMIVCGLSKSGYRVVQEFIDLGYEVVAIDRDAQGEFNELVRGQGVPVLIGDTRQEELLRAAGVGFCQALLVTSDDDLTNLDTALTAREIRPDVHIVLGVFNEALASKVEGAFGIRTAFSTPMLAAPTFAAAALMRGVRHALHVGSRLLSTLELSIRPDGMLDGRFIGKIEQELNLSVIELHRHGSETSALRPRPDYRLGNGDRIVVVGELLALDQLRRLNQEINNDPLGRNREAVLTRLQRRGLPLTDEAAPSG